MVVAVTTGTGGPCTLGMLLTEIGHGARLVCGDAAALRRPIARVDLWFAGDPVPTVPNTLTVCHLPDRSDLSPLSDLFDSDLALMLAVPFDDDAGVLRRFPRLTTHAVVGLSAEVNLADVIAIVASADHAAVEQVSRRLAQLQRSLSQALNDASPMAALLSRLKRTCNATVALVDMAGHAVHATGPLPLAVLHEQMQDGGSSSIVLDVDGWHGVAQRVEDSLDGDRPFGWLVAAARRSPFPDPFVRAAVEMAATLVETAHRIAIAERTQDRAVRASVLEQLLALHMTRDDPELAGRVAGLGIRFDDELRVLIAKPVQRTPSRPDRETAAQVGVAIAQVLRAAGVAEFLTVRAEAVVLLVQCSPAAARRLLVADQAAHELQVGAGRRVGAVGDVVDSYNDALLAVRSLEHPDRSGFVAFEDFDFATRLFSAVGLDRMVEWAREFFRPIEGRELLMGALQSYFAHGQNIRAAAGELFVHHNSLRYRLAKAEELLGVSLNDPAAISSTYLALTALDLVDAPGSTSLPHDGRAASATTLHGTESVDAATDLRRPDATGRELGVAHDPER
jgi:sugar diacid utilization regulator